MFVRENLLNWMRLMERVSWFVFVFALIVDQMRVEVKLIHPDPALGQNWMLAGLSSDGLAEPPVCEPSEHPEVRHVKGFFVNMQAMQHE